MEYCEFLNSLKAEKRLRTIPAENDTAAIDLLSNDYMGLAARAGDFREEFISRFPDAQFTSAASRLLSRRQKYHGLLEDLLADLYGRPALLFNSGYHANVGLLQGLAISGTLILSDKLIHASSIDGIRLSKADFKRFAHNDADAIKKLLEQHASNYDRVLVVIESIYSMDGDTAPLKEIVALKKDYPNMLICLDEAHAFGVRGRCGLGLAEEQGVLNDIDIIIGTLGKAAASTGAFVTASDEIISMLVNTARSFIFSTALPPVNCAWSIMMIGRLIEMNAEREYLQRLSDEFRNEIERITGLSSPSSTQIIPVITGDADKALRLAETCKKEGFDCMAIRRPTVPPGGERVRISLNAGLDMQMLMPITQVINKFMNGRL